MKRSLGVTLLAFGTALVAIYSQFAAISLLLTDRVAGATNGFESALTLITGLAFLALTLLAYATAVGLWFRWSWSARAAVAVYVTLFVANAALSIVLTNLVTAGVMTLGVVAALVYLRRPVVRTEIEGPRQPASDPGQVVEPTPVARLAH